MAIGEDKGVKLLRKVLELDPIEFLGICKILGVKLTSEEQENKGEEKVDVLLNVRPTEEIIEEAVDKIAHLNRTQGRNLQKILKAATKGK